MRCLRFYSITVVVIVLAIIASWAHASPLLPQVLGDPFPRYVDCPDQQDRNEWSVFAPESTGTSIGSGALWQYPSNGWRLLAAGRINSSEQGWFPLVGRQPYDRHTPRLAQAFSGPADAPSTQAAVRQSGSYPELTIGQPLTGQSLSGYGDVKYYQVPATSGEHIFVLLDKGIRASSYLSIAEGELPGRGSYASSSDQAVELVASGDGYAYVRVESSSPILFSLAL